MQILVPKIDPIYPNANSGENALLAEITKRAQAYIRTDAFSRFYGRRNPVISAALVVRARDFMVAARIKRRSLRSIFYRY